MIYIIIILSVITDRITKILAVKNLQDKSIEIINGVFRLSYVENTGAAFGIGGKSTALLTVFSVLILIGVIFALVKYKPTEKTAKISASLVIGGALGNIIDRVVQGYVVDFLDFYLINYPVFNFADCCIVVGAILFCIYVLFIYDDKKVEK